jgi:lysophospholipase L1-like esterase
VKIPTISVASLPASTSSSARAGLLCPARLPTASRSGHQTLAFQRDPANPARLLPAYDSGDQLHLNPTGLQAMADAIDLALFND